MLDEKVLQKVQAWCDRGGGLIAIGGPINTLQLARPGAYKDKLKPILELYPVILKDIRLDDLERRLDHPWPLTLDGASPDMDFLSLADEVDSGKESFLSDWEAFFGRAQERARTAPRRSAASSTTIQWSRRRPATPWWPASSTRCPRTRTAGRCRGSC